MSGYDALGYRAAAAFERENASDPSAVLASWKRYAVWHPTRNWLWFSPKVEQHRLADLEQQARQQQRDTELAELRRTASDPDTDPDWVQLSGSRLYTLISALACHLGLTVTGGAQGVGRATTRTVVLTIVALIIVDLIFTSVFYAMGW